MSGFADSRTRRATATSWLLPGLALTCVLLVSFTSFAPLRAIGALLLVLVVPGYAVVACLFLKNERRRGELWLLVPALSVAITILVCLVLAALHVYSRYTAAASLGTFSGATVFWGSPGARRDPRLHVNWRHLLLLTVTASATVALVTAAMAISVRSYNADAAKATSVAVWVKPSDDSLSLGLRGPGLGTLLLDVYVTRNGRLLASWSRVSLGHDALWARTIRLPRQRLTATEPLLVEVKDKNRLLESIPVVLDPRAGTTGR